jgi:hypothetical protein
MKSEHKILKIINEEVKLFETEVDSHALLRLEQRLDLMSKNGDITQEENNTIRKNLNNIISYEKFNPNKSYGFLLGTFKPNPKSKLYTITNKQNPGIPFYEINSPDDSNELLKDSTGDEFWAIVRNNVITTVMLRKRLQRESAGEERTVSGEHGKGGLGVDRVILNFDDFLQLIEKEKQVQKEKEQAKLQLQEKMVNINGVLWVIDDTNQRVYKKNNPNIFVKFDDVLEYTDWNDKTKEEILNRIS